jgi:hypothetical protein
VGQEKAFRFYGRVHLASARGSSRGLVKQASFHSVPDE